MSKLHKHINEHGPEGCEHSQNTDIDMDTNTDVDTWIEFSNCLDQDILSNTRMSEIRNQLKFKPIWK
jgi:hypothetical protein